MASIRRRAAAATLSLLALIPALGAGAEDGAVLLSRVTWLEEGVGFGGISGLALLPGGTEVLAVTDRAILVTGRLRRSSDGRLTGVALVTQAHLPDRLDQPAQGFDSDAEALRLMADGSVLIGFEGKTRIERFHPPDWRREPLQMWDALRDHWGNRGIEALAPLGDGRTLVVLEVPDEGAGYRTLIHDGIKTWTAGPALPTDGRFMAVDAVLGPDGGLYLLERAHSLFWGYQSRISLYPSGFAAPRILMQTGWSVGDNFEGFDLRTNADGHLIALLVSDNNFNPLTPTVVAEYDLGLSPLQADGP